MMATHVVVKKRLLQGKPCPVLEQVNTKNPGRPPGTAVPPGKCIEFKLYALLLDS
jgi:hypothetical protein